MSAAVLLLLAACASRDGGPRRAPAPNNNADDTAAPADTGETGETRETGETGDGGETGDTGAPAPPPAPARYPAGELHSPVTAFVRDRLVALRAAGSRLDAQVFMKVGDSITVDPNALGCFVSDSVNLGGRDALETTIDHFAAGEAGSGSPWERDSHAAEVGESASWAMSGDPSPVDRELDRLDPAFAVVQYGTNDMHLAGTYRDAIDPFATAMLDLVDHLLDASVVPVLVTIPPRLDDADADAWVPKYNAVTRGIAEGRQIPLVDLELGLRALDGYGLYPDGVHLEPYSDGACKLGENGLAYGCNVRNLLVLEGLDRARRAALDAEILDEEALTWTGTGTEADPVLIEGGFPFTHLGDTASAGAARVDRYGGCDDDTDRSGREVLYRFELTRETTIRAFVFDRGDVDVDVAFLGEGAGGGDCAEIDDGHVRKTLDPGTWHLVVDTRVSGGEARAGEYLLVVVED